MDVCVSRTQIIESMRTHTKKAYARLHCNIHTDVNTPSRALYPRRTVQRVFHRNDPRPSTLSPSFDIASSCNGPSPEHDSIFRLNRKGGEEDEITKKIVRRERERERRERERDRVDGEGERT